MYYAGRRAQRTIAETKQQARGLIPQPSGGDARIVFGEREHMIVFEQAHSTICILVK